MSGTVPQPTPIFHITNIDNLPLIIANGTLRTIADINAAGAVYTSIAHQNIQDRRAYLEPDAVSVDVLAFETLAANGSNGNLARAEKLYQGALLDGLGVRDPAFNEWLDQERSRLHELAVNAVDRLLAGLLRAGDPSAGPKDYVHWITQVSNPFAREEDRERLVKGLRLAGLPA